MFKQVWEYKKKDIERKLNREGISANLRSQYLLFGRNLLRKQEKHGWGRIPQGEIQLLEKQIKNGLNEKILKQIIGLIVGSYP